MADAKKGSKKRKAAKAKSPRARRRAPDPRAAAIQAALRLAELQGWRGTTLDDIAGEAGLEPDALRAHFATKTGILAAYMTDIDKALLDGADDALGEEAVRDRLFDVIMRRLDALAPHKAAVEAIARDLGRDPCAGARFAAGPFRRSLDCMLQAAGVRDWGPLQALQRKGLGLIYLNTLRVWFADDTADMGKTMAALDKALARADRLVATFCPGGRREPSEAAA